MHKYYILDDEEKRYIDKIKDGFILLLNDDKQIDLATVNKVNCEYEDGHIEEISIRQYMLLTEQLGEGNEWEVNKWMVYVFLCFISFIINFGFCFAGIFITLYTIPLVLLAFFCCYQLKKINRIKTSVVCFVLQMIAFVGYPLGSYFFSHFQYTGVIGGGGL